MQVFGVLWFMIVRGSYGVEHDLASDGRFALLLCYVCLILEDEHCDMNLDRQQSSLSIS